jgi:hypothetical protein
MLGNIRGLSDWCCKDCKVIYRLWKQRIVKQNILDGDLKFTMTIGFGGKSSNHWNTTENNLENGKEYAGLTQSPCKKLMLDQWVLKIKERFAGHKSFLPQEMAQREVWIGSFHGR